MSFVWDDDKKASDLVLEEGGAKMTMHNETQGNFHTSVGAVVMQHGRHEWDCVMSGTLCTRIKIGVVRDGGIRDYNANMNNTRQAFLLYEVTWNYVLGSLTGGPREPSMMHELGKVKLGERAGVIVDFNENYMQFTRNGVPVGSRVVGTRGLRLRACANIDLEGEAVTLANYTLNGGGVAVPVAEATQGDEGLADTTELQAGASAGSSVGTGTAAATLPPIAPPTTTAGNMSSNNSSSSDEESESGEDDGVEEREQ